VSIYYATATKCHRLKPCARPRFEQPKVPSTGDQQVIDVFGGDHHMEGIKIATVQTGEKPFAR